MAAGPHPYFHRLRAEDPVHWDDEHRAYVLTRYDDVVAAFRDPRLSSERMPVRHLDKWMVFLDPPDHTRLRHLVDTAFSARAMAAPRARVAVLVDAIFDDLHGEVDWLDRVAVPLPATVIAEMLGVSPSDRQQFLMWSADIAGVVFSTTGDAGRRQRAEDGIREFEAYFRALLAHYREEPADNLLSALAAIDGLMEDEVLATCTLLLFAGHSTTTSLLTAAPWLLEKWPEEKGRLAGDVVRRRGFVEECLRLEGPAAFMTRVAREEFALGNRTIQAGARLFLGISAANRDPTKFADPDSLDPTRRPNPHIGFGHGIHHCLGAPLARMEGEIVVERLLQRFPGFRVVESNWSGGLLGRSINRITVDVGPHSPHDTGLSAPGTGS